MSADPAISSKRTLVLLPGFDGAGSLFTPLRRALEPNFQTVVITYPADSPRTYDELCTEVLRELPKTPHVIVAESFSGPVALKIAALRPQGLRALILSTSFAANPHPWILALVSSLLSPWCFRLPLPKWTIRALLIGADAPVEVCQAVQDTVKTVDPEVMDFRLREVMRADATAELRQCPVPIFYLSATRDRLLGKRVVRSLLAARPDATVIHVPGPHLLLQAAPGACARHIEAMVAGLNLDDRL